MKNKLKITMALCAVIIGLAVLAENILAYQYLPRIFGISLIITGIAAFIIALIAAVAIDFSAGDYECKKCGSRFTPTLGAYILGVHTLTTRCLKCPKCGKKSFCKRRLDEEI